MSRRIRVLMIFPRFNPHSFWSYEGAVEVLGAKYPAAPLGMITLAALLPAEWDIRLINRNTEALEEHDLDWPDMVMTGGMLSQQNDALALIERCRARNLPVVVGGPDATSSPHIYDRADFQVLGEVEDIIVDFIAAWERGERHGRFTAPRFQVNVTKTPIPRFDLLKFKDYLYIGLQFSRGCPFTCEFCDIIELYGRNPRAKTNDQMLAELDRLYELGYRGHLDFVDDNLIGNKKAVKLFLPHLIAWQKRRRYPFTFSTEASLNIADDPALMTMMRDANFFGFFVGIESPDPETLVQTAKKQNIKHEIYESVHKIYAHGMILFPGFIVGFDSEKQGVADGIIQCVEDAALPMGMLGLLYALPGTQLTRRLTKEGRLHPETGHDLDSRQGDFALSGLNFDTLRPRADILRDFAGVLRRLYEPKAYFGRLRRAVLPMQRVKLPAWIAIRDSLREIDRFFRIMWEVTLHRPDMRWPVWKLIVECLIRNPNAVRNIMVMVVFYLYLAPLSRFWIGETERQIEAIESGRWQPPLATRTPALAPV
ncbi:MAG: B12-binding domain-containing radical SAM protein [Rhizobiales bacterium 62-17]|nr:B12-binding domain-containing radical SAM protein [Hyphomicrobiales bacterium]OJY05273.1 MAG: B12-binding domain-containing radical SAM protein [Rhizobiales bacterium 62-17]